METFEPKIVAFLCNWCSYAGADLAGIGRYQYPPNIRVIRVPCSGRVDPLFLLKALQNGADGVLVSGCHPGDCHYIEGNYFARRKFAILKSILEYLGLEEGRVQFSWVSAAEGERFSKVISEVVESVRLLGPAEKLVRRFEIPPDVKAQLDRETAEEEAECPHHPAATGAVPAGVSAPGAGASAPNSACETPARKGAHS